jgi:4-amino-4-deoxy-L-arabinose transferase-like glycosyltransferase
MRGNQLMLTRALRRIESQPLWFWLIALAVLGAGLGLRNPWPPDEPRFALIARDMLLSHDWWIPRVAGDVYPDKPPAFMWAIASMTWLTGSLRVGFLLPSLLAGLGTLWLVKDLATRLWDPRTGLIAAATLLVTLQFTTQARFAQIDMLLVGFTTLGLYGLLRHLLRGPDWGAFTLGSFAMGLGVITKAVGFLPLFILPVWFYLGWRRWPGAEFRWDPRWLLGPLALVAAIALWLVPMWLITESGSPEFASYRHDLLFTQTVTRYVSAWHHVKPIWYYLVQVIPGLWLPVIAALPWLLPSWRRALAERDLRIALLLAYVVLIVLFFSFSPGKRGVYVFPALPALVLAASPYLSAICERINAQRTAIVGLVLAVLLPTVAIALALSGRISALAEDDLALIAVPAWTLLALMGGAAVAWSWAGGRTRAVASLVGWIATAWILYGLVLMPALDRIRSGRLVMDAAEQALAPGQQLGVIAFLEQQVLQTDRSLVHFGFRRRDQQQQAEDGAAWLLASNDNRLLVQGQAMMGCWDPGALTRIAYAHRRDWYLVGAEDLTPACRAVASELADWRERLRRYDRSNSTSINR